MTSKNKKVLIISIIAILTLINTSAIITIFYHKHQIRKKFKTCEFKRKEKLHHHKRICMFMKRELSLNDKQFEEFGKLRQENISKTEQYANKIRFFKSKIIDELTNENTNNVILSQLADSVGMQNKLLQLEMNNHFIRVKKILDVEQIDKFNKFMHRMGKTHEFHHRIKKRGFNPHHDL